MKKIVSVCLVLVMMLSVFGITAFAEPIVGYSDIRIEDVYYTIADDYATVSGNSFKPSSIKIILLLFSSALANIILCL